MKTLTTTLALVLAVGFLAAMPSGSQLHINLVGHRPNMIIVFNGQSYSTAGNALNMGMVAPGTYPIKVMRPSHWGDQGVVYAGSISVPHHSDVTAFITPNGMKVSAQPLANNGPSYWDGNCGNGTVVIPNANGNGGFVSQRPQHQRPIEPIVCAPVMIGMHPDVFASALRSIELQSFDSDQIRVAKQVIRTNGASSHQIAEIMRLLSFESSRLEIAKFGFQFVGDPANYYVVNDVFWFSSSVRELDRFINGY
ncbi:MAG: DUF4476 domain-containing protein [Flavobacteriales bacterium]|nr:DUF4476 domain-containing protein [Flavobacteriales bacterium]